MSDFLSGFNPNSYESKPEDNGEKSTEKQVDEEIPLRRSDKSDGDHEIQIDKDYNRKAKRRKILLTFIFLLVGCLILVIHYYTSTIEMPDFKGSDVSELREWADENNVKLALKQEYSGDIPTNAVISQVEKAGNRVKKSGEIGAIVSQGADPEEHIELPDFSAMSMDDANNWVENNQADNITITSEYSEDVAKGKYIKEKFENSDVTTDNYLRKNSLIVYYSKGAETFEKNITVEDFTGKTKAEVESWAKEKGIKLKFEEKTSETIEMGLIISQSTASGEKIAKNDEMTLELSLGKGVEVPNFGYYSMEEARNMTDLQVSVKEQFSLDYNYGTLLYQSIEAGSELTEKDDKNVEVIYSVGRPYLKDYRSQVEGDLPKLFYDDYQSKGANVKYNTYEVNSAEPKGTIVEMSNYNTYIGLDYTVSIGVSNGKYYDGSSINNNDG